MFPQVSRCSAACDILRSSVVGDLSALSRILGIAVALPCAGRGVPDIP
jgi:hypothetical protein